MELPLPRWRVHSVAGGLSASALLAAASWREIDPLPPLLLSQGGGAPLQATIVRLAASAERLHVRFDCVDRDAWGTFTRRDDPLYQEEAVEVFLAPGIGTPKEYFEIEVSPAGVVFDALISNPFSRRSDMEGDPSWDCPGLLWEVGWGEEREDWWAALSIPWASVGAQTSAPPPTLWRANFYRIERPRDGAAEFSAWSPTLVEPADFHRPERFGVLEVGADAGA